MKKKNRVVNICIAVGVIVLALSYLGYNIYLHQIGKITTETAVATYVDETIETTGYVVRDEAHISGGVNTSILTSSSDGIYLALVEDGARVAANDAVALRFSNESAAQSYKQLEQVKDRISYYKQLQSQSVLSTVDVSSLDSRIDTYIGSYIDCIDRNDLSKLGNAVSSLEHSITSRQIATGTKIDFSAILEELTQQKNTLSSTAVSSQTLTTGYAGYFVSTVDGYESKADYKAVKSLTVSDIDALIKSSPDEVDSNAFGKVVGAFDWYVVCNVPETILSYVSKGTTVGVSFGETGGVSVNMDVYSLSESKDGTVAAVLKCDTMSSAIANLRIESISITVNTYNGFRINNSALRQIDGTMGVYIVYGNSVKFRQADVLYYGNGFVVVAVDDGSESEYSRLKQYDTVITKGRNLYDGKLIY